MDEEWKELMIEEIREEKAEEIAELIEKWNELMDELGETPVLDDISGIREIIDWIEQKQILMITQIH